MIPTPLLTSSGRCVRYSDAWITGLDITEHSEPILDAGVSELDLKYFIYQCRDITAQDRVKLGGQSERGM